MKNENLVNICADSLIYLLEDVLTKPYLSLSEKEDAVRTAAEERIPAYFHRLLCGTGTDGILLNVNYDLSYIPVPGFDTAWQRADGTPIAYDAPDCVDHWGRLYVTAHQCGVDPFRYAMDAIRKEGGEVWFSVRMNDYHYLRIPNAVCTFWTEHPEYRVSENGVFDFAHPEVREYYKEYILTHRINRTEAYDKIEEFKEMAKQFDTIDNWLEYINNNNISMNNSKNTVLVENIKASKNSYPQDNDNAVHFHTMHSCKGLEYKVVFIMDVVEGIIPYNKAVLDYEIEEERRLMYVAMTRAKEKLYLLYAKSRYNKDTTISRFVTEIDDHYVDYSFSESSCS